jgi:pimeloyl-ACP methyl ester carboxylesterase
MATTAAAAALADKQQLPALKVMYATQKGTARRYAQTIVEQALASGAVSSAVGFKLPGPLATTLGLAKRTPLVGALSPGRISQKRRNHWPSIEAALDNFKQKKAFAHWDPQVLHDYVTHGTVERGGERYLRFDRDVETAIYNSLPHKLDSLLKRKPLKCPVAFIGGTHSAEMRQAGMEATLQVVKGRVMMLDGSHLIPMEKPLATAAAIEASLRNLGAESGAELGA